MSDDIEAPIVAGAIAALRKRAERQTRIAQEGQIAGERGSVIRSGEASIAHVPAEALTGNCRRACGGAVAVNDNRDERETLTLMAKVMVRFRPRGRLPPHHRAQAFGWSKLGASTATSRARSTAWCPSWDKTKRKTRGSSTNGHVPVGTDWRSGRVPSDAASLLREKRGSAAYGLPCGA